METSEPWNECQGCTEEVFLKQRDTVQLKQVQEEQGWLFSPLLVLGKCVVEDKVCCLHYHDKDCDAVQKQLPPDYCVVPYDDNEVIDKTYDYVVKKLQTFNFHDPESPLLPGKHIDFGHKDYNFDGRVYEYLPSESYPEVEKDQHRDAMVKFYYYLVAYLNMAEEEAQLVLAMQNLAEQKLISLAKLV
jgi:hypothetical protein